MSSLFRPAALLVFAALVGSSALQAACSAPDELDQGSTEQDVRSGYGYGYGYGYGGGGYGYGYGYGYGARGSR